MTRNEIDKVTLTELADNQHVCPDPDKGLRELLEWMDGPTGLDDGHVKNIIREEIKYRLAEDCLENHDGDS